MLFLILLSFNIIILFFGLILSYFTLSKSKTSYIHKQLTIFNIIGSVLLCVYSLTGTLPISFISHIINIWALELTTVVCYINALQYTFIIWKNLLMPNESIIKKYPFSKLLILLQISTVIIVITNCILVSVLNENIFIGVTLIILSIVSIIYGTTMKYLKQTILDKLEKSKQSTSNTFLKVLMWVTLSFACLLGIIQFMLAINIFINPQPYIKETIDEPMIAFGHTIFLFILSVYNFKSNMKKSRN